MPCTSIGSAAGPLACAFLVGMAFQGLLGCFPRTNEEALKAYIDRHMLRLDAELRRELGTKAEPMQLTPAGVDSELRLDLGTKAEPLQLAPATIDAEPRRDLGTRAEPLRLTPARIDMERRGELDTKAKPLQLTPGRIGMEFRHELETKTDAVQLTPARTPEHTFEHGDGEGGATAVDHNSSSVVALGGADSNIELEGDRGVDLTAWAPSVNSRAVAVLDEAQTHPDGTPSADSYGPLFFDLLVSAVIVGLFINLRLTQAQVRVLTAMKDDRTKSLASENVRLANIASGLRDSACAASRSLEARTEEVAALRRDKIQLGAELATRSSELDTALEKIVELEAKLDKRSEVQRMRRAAVSIGVVKYRCGVGDEQAEALRADARLALRDRGCFKEAAAAVWEEADRRLQGFWSAVVSDYIPPGPIVGNGKWLILGFGDLYITVFQS